jgi:hypothetical protein
VAVPVATLEQGVQDQALPAALALAEQEGDDDPAVAGRALVLASFDAGVRALLELRGGEGASALPVIRALLLREPQ